MKDEELKKRIEEIIQKTARFYPQLDFSHPVNKFPISFRKTSFRKIR